MKKSYLAVLHTKLWLAFIQLDSGGERGKQQEIQIAQLVLPQVDNCFAQLSAQFCVIFSVHPAINWKLQLATSEMNWKGIKKS